VIVRAGYEDGGCGFCGLHLFCACILGMVPQYAMPVNARRLCRNLGDGF